MERSQTVNFTLEISRTSRLAAPQNFQPMDDEKPVESDHKLFGLDINDKKTPYIVFGVISAVWVIYWLVLVLTIKNYNHDWQVRGLFGDMFGAINALFSGLAFAGLIITILLQREELKAQKEELRNNTQALKDQRLEMNHQVTAMQQQGQEMERQNRNIKRQRLETTLYNMWNIHFGIRDWIYIYQDTTQHKGILAFVHFVNVIHKYAFDHQTAKYQDERRVVRTSSLIVGINKANDDSVFFLTAEPYFKSLKLIYSTIKDSDLETEAASRYYANMKAYLTTNEIRVLVYYINYLKEKGRPDPDLIQMNTDLNLMDGFFADLSELTRQRVIFDKGQF